MKPPIRRSSVKLVLASSLPLALTACGPQEELYTVTQQSNYDSVAACVADKVPEPACNDAFKRALADYQRNAPTFFTKAECEAQFTPDGCQITVGGRYMPRMSGFELQTSAEVTQSQLDAGYAQGGGYGHVATAAVAGMLLAQMGNSAGRHYNAQPLYAYRDGAGQRHGLLGQRYGATGGGIQRVKQDEESSSSSSGGGGGGGYGGSSRNESRSATSASVTRGGFGGQATARSGWGGRSGSFFGG
ncbi:DUF1190 domain-containing protein [Pseudomonas sp. CC120222-01a]|uniref:DUF1190 domain-containing protein n=1 Tax=Pseudomonas sp. CC120222-01a TaxID=1378075 RepID=UPI000D94D9B7|nr:DUF1190 domain-containing protein [Pseudomonas sp. CC120222-01a]PVZ43902.1 uncharacterized protein YgiB involved in biofilm formation [Pseudomonas sp. CC120222-01a]